MLATLRVVFAFLAISTAGFFMARLADSFINPSGEPRLREPLVSKEDSRIQAIDAPAIEEVDAIESPTDSLVASYFGSTDGNAAFVLKRKLDALDLDHLEDLYIEALSYDLIDRKAFEAARIALERIASLDPNRAVQLLYSLAPAEKEELATALVKGWAQNDILSVWDWVDSAWIDRDGEFIDRSLQNAMFQEALDAILKDGSQYQIATDLVSSVVEPGLRNELADLIAFYVVSENPVQALDRLDFDGGDLVDNAIMNAIIDEWSQRDSLGAMAWTLENETQVSRDGARAIAKDLLLNGIYEELGRFHSNLVASHKRDSVAWESARLLARRDPVSSIEWLSAIESIADRYSAYSDSLFEIGHDDFQSSVQYAELAYGVADIDRETALFEALQSWASVDGEQVRQYLDSSDATASSVSLLALREALN